MAYQYLNNNPLNRNRGDCAVRAIATILDEDWYTVYLELCLQGFALADMPNSVEVYTEYLRSKGYRRYIIPNTCPHCYTIEDFSLDNPVGRYLVVTQTHIVAIVDGNVIDTWNSSDEIPIYYFQKE